MALLESNIAAPPTRKRQLGMSIERSLPKYQFCVMFSVLTTMQFLFGYICSNRSPLSAAAASKQCQSMNLHTHEIEEVSCLRVPAGTKVYICNAATVVNRCRKCWEPGHQYPLTQFFRHESDSFGNAQTCSNSLARPMEMMPAEQPMPDRL